MKQRMVLAAALALALTSPAAAEPATRLAQAASNVLPGYEILTILRSTGLDPIGQPVRRGNTYVLRATDDDGEEVRVVVDARSGEVMSITPLASAGTSRPARPGVSMGPYEPGPLPGGGPPGVYRSGPPIIYEEGPPPVYGPRPPGAIPGPPPGRYSSAPPSVPPGAPPSAPTGARSPSAAAPSEVQEITTPDGAAGPLPPPPERFPQRAAPPSAGKPAPPPRRAAATPPATPLPKSRPGAPTTPAASPDADASPLPPPMPLNPPGAENVPH